MGNRRKGEQGSIPFRTGRFFNIDAEWYFTCRDGLDYGPFDSKDHAQTALQQHLDHNHASADTSQNNIPQQGH